MSFLDDLKGERLALDSGLPPDEVAERLDARIESAWTPFATGVTGWVAFGRFALRYRRYAWLWRNSFAVLTGQIRAHGAGSRIVVYYGAPRVLLLYPPAAIVLLVLVMGGPGRIASFFWPLIFLGAPLAVWVMISLRALGADADDDLAKLLAVVEAAAEPAA